MNLNGDIIIIEDDIDDAEILIELFQKVFNENHYSNKVVHISTPETVVDFMNNQTESPFLIISDINMPKLDGFALREIIFNDPVLNEKCVPYIFLTTSGDDHDFMKRAYKLSIQGYFKKPNDFNEYYNLLNDIVRYWKVAKLANRRY